MAINRGVKTGGFTLIEVMVALVVVAVALPALLTLVMTQLDGSAMIREKTQAFWVAENEMTRLRLRKKLVTDFSIPDEDNGTVSLSGQEWYWELDSERTEVDEFLRVDIAVYRDENRDSSLAILSGFFHEAP